MAKREDISQDVNAGEGGGSSGSPKPDTSPTSEAVTSSNAAFQLAQANTAEQQPAENQVFDLENAPVKATFDSAEAGARIELPPGTDISKVFVSGLNLYFIQPDGSVIVIVGGAVNFPTLVIGPGVEIASEQLQQLFENVQEGVPTAGPETPGGPNSSGGNFAVDPGSIGDPIDLSELLELTSQSFALLGTDEIREPDLLEADLDAPAIGEPQMVALEEDDLPEGHEDAVVDQSSQRDPNLTTATGQLNVSGATSITFDPDIEAPEGLTSNGRPVVYQLFNDGTLLVAFVDKDGNGDFNGDLPEDSVSTPFESTFSGKNEPDWPVFVIEISQDLNPNGEYTVRLLDNIDHDTPSKDGDDGTTDGLPLTNPDDLTNEDFETENPQLEDEELEFLNFEFVASNGGGSTPGEFIIKIQDDIPEVHTKNQHKIIELQKGVGVGEADENDLLFKIPDGADLNIDISDLTSDAGFANTLGYYFADADGNPISGVIIEDDARSDSDGDEGDFIPASEVPEGAMFLGFFLIPNGDGEQNLNEETPVFFNEVVVPGEGTFFQAFLDSDFTQPIDSAQGFVLYSDRRLNPDLDPDGNTTPEDDFELMGMEDDDLSGEFDSNWEDKVFGSDKDFNDVQFNITVKAKVEFLLQVDEDDIDNFDSYFRPYGGETIEGSTGTSPDDGNADGSFTGNPIVASGGPAVSHASLGIYFGSDDSNLEASRPGYPSSDNDGTEFFDADDGAVNFSDTTNGQPANSITFGGNGHDFLNGEKVVYTTDNPSSDDTWIPGLEPGAYYVHVVDSNTIQLFATQDGAEGTSTTDTMPVELTGESASGTQFIHKAGDRSLIFDPNQDGNMPEGLTSKGGQIVYEISDDGTLLRGFVDGGSNVKAGNDDDDDDGNYEYTPTFDPNGYSGDRLVFEVELSDQGLGEVWFKLHDQVDHPNPGVGNVGKAVEDLTWIKFDFIATDSDGDMVMDSFTIDIKDDVPVLNGEMVMRTVDEDDIATADIKIPGVNEGSLGTSPDDGLEDGSATGFPGPPEESVGPALVTGDLSGLVEVGSDEHENGGLKFAFIDEADARAKLEALGLRSKASDQSDSEFYDGGPVKL